MFKIITLLGSPRRNGNSEQLAAAFAKGASASGHAVQTIRVHTLKIGGCIDCRRCWMNGSHCFLHDDMTGIYGALDAADVFVFAVPLYFYSWPSQIKPVWDRLLPYFSPDAKADIRGKRAVLLAVAGDESPSCFDGLRKSFELACWYCKLEIAGEIFANGVYAVGDISSGGWLSEAEALGRSL